MGLPLKFAIGVAIVTAISVSLTVYGYARLHALDTPIRFTATILPEKTYLRREHVLGAYLVTNDTSYYGSLAVIRKNMQSMISTYNSLQEQATLYIDTMPTFLQNQGLYELLYERNCTNAEGLKVGLCTGLLQLDQLYNENELKLQQLKEETITLKNKEYWTLNELDDSIIPQWHMEFETKTKDFFLKIVNRDSIVVLTLFILSVPAAALAYVIVHFPLQKIRKTHHLKLRMFLLIPGDVVDTVPIIKRYLETGKHSNREKEMEKLIEETKTKTASILQAAADAIIVYNAVGGTIETFNTAAERIFGYTSSEILGQPLSTVLPSESGDSSRFGKHKDGTLIPVFVSQSSTSSGGVSAAFIRDTRDIQEFQQLIKQNEALLCTMVPTKIAARLKDIIANESNTARLIADHHESVSILFADIVKFSQWSTTMTPEKLVFLLNSLVSTWDTIALQCGVEKIKTIGDCYMCVCGCPDESLQHAEKLVNFATQMVTSLEAFNAENSTQVKIRVGINSGPVVAGVIGLSKVIYDLWGPSVNMASRMESSGFPMTVQISENTFDLLSEETSQKFKPRGEIEVKGGFKVKAYTCQVTPSGSDMLTASNLVRHIEKNNKGSTAALLQNISFLSSTVSSGGSTLSSKMLSSSSSSSSESSLWDRE